MRASLLLSSSLLLTLACGGTPPPASTPRPVKTETAPPAGNTIRYVAIPTGPLLATVKADVSSAKTWAADPAHQKQIKPVFRHLLAKSDGTPAGDAVARKKIDALLARLVAGEPFEKLARESDDPGSTQQASAERLAKALGRK